MPIASTEQMQRSFLEEYNSNHAILKYSSQTAGHGVSYLIEHEYADVYDQAIETCRRTSSEPLRLLEFGCGAGMNVIGLLSRLARHSIPIKDAFGTDFSESLIESARREARAFLPPVLREKLSFHVASNERLGVELAAATGTSAGALYRFLRLHFRRQYVPLLSPAPHRERLRGRHVPTTQAWRNVRDD